MEDRIYLHFKNDEEFVKNVLDFRFRALENYEIILTSFLDLHRIDIIKKVIGKKDGLKIITYGGIDDSDYQRVIICRSDIEISEKDFNITKIRIKYNNKFSSIRHKDVLGALISLGVKREVFGDILLDENNCYFVCDSNIYMYIFMNLTQIARTKVILEEVSLNLTKKQTYKKKTFFIASFRLDVIISTVFSISRSKAKEYILGNLVKVNHKEVELVAFLCHNNDMISLRKFGRVIIKDLSKTTRGNNHIIEGWFYE